MTARAAAPDRLDAVIVGAGPAGLNAATYLGRFRRRFLVVHDGCSRARWIPRSHNHPGFPGGIHGPTLLRRMRAQAERFGARFLEGRVEVVEREPGGAGFAISGDGFDLRARTVLLATGVHDNLPPLKGVEPAIRRGLVRICPICDAYEVMGRRVALVGDGDLGGREARFLRDYCEAVTLVHVGAPEALSPVERAALAAFAVRVREAALADLSLTRDRAVLKIGEGPAEEFEALYAALGCAARSTLAERAGVAVTDQGYLIAGQAHQETATPGIYAAGDVVRGLNQITVAQAEAAIAATAMHNFLRERDGDLVGSRLGGKASKTAATA
jgi:thioredoxin reductase (NADPH)